MRKLRNLLIQHKVMSIAALVLLVGAIGAGAYFFWPREAPPPVDPEQAKFEQLQKERQSEIEEVGKQVDLPVDEEPITATVSDRNALQGQEFFKEALNGDRVLMYPKAEKAYLYRPSEDRVIAVAPLDFQEDGEVAATSSASASESASVE